jgi:GNAT superfamily N-acetyltransferase
LARLEGELIGFGEWSVDPEDNPANLWLGAYIRPEHRRAGHGARLVGDILDAALAAMPRVTTAGFCLQLNRPIGADLQALVEVRWGLAPRIVERKSRLNLAQVDRAWVLGELALRRRRVGDRYRLLFFTMDDFPPPETGFDVDRYLDLMTEVEALMPLEDLDELPERYDRPRFESIISRQARRGRQIWNLVALDAGGSAFAGYTAINFSPANPVLVEQWGTGVVRAEQGNGLGKLLKLEMLAKLQDELPAARVIETDNARSNAAMISINTDLGFREHYLEHCYQVPIDQLRELLRLTAG